MHIMMSGDIFSWRHILKWVCVNEVSFLRLESSILTPRSCMSVVNKLMKRGFWKPGTDAFLGWPLHEWQSSNRKAHNPLGHHGAQAAWGCPPSRGVCLFCRLGTVLWPFLFTRERTEAAVLQLLWKHCWKTTERSFHSRTHPGKNPPEQTNLPNERPSGLNHRPLG